MKLKNELIFFKLLIWSMRKERFRYKIKALLSTFREDSYFYILRFYLKFKFFKVSLFKIFFKYLIKIYPENVKGKLTGIVVYGLINEMRTKRKCKHENREYDLFDDYKFTKNSVVLTVPNWCSNCIKIKENEVNENYNFREDIFYYKFKFFMSNPDHDWEYNSLRFKGFYDLDYLDSDFDPDNIDNELEVTFSSAHDAIPYEMVQLEITYERCSKEEYQKLIDNNDREIVKFAGKKGQHRMFPKSFILVIIILGLYMLIDYFFFNQYYKIILNIIPLFFLGEAIYNMFKTRRI